MDEDMRTFHVIPADIKILYDDNEQDKESKRIHKLGGFIKWYAPEFGFYTVWLPIKKKGCENYE